MPRPALVTKRNATFQHWQTLLTNRTKRHRAGEFIVQGVRPISQAVEHGWTARQLLYAEQPKSSWAKDILATSEAQQFELSEELFAELAGKDEPGELLGVFATKPDDLDRIDPSRGPVVVFDRPSTPGNIGAIARSTDALGGAGLIVTGHAADVYDPKSVRASTGSLFALPVVRAASHHEVLAWIATSSPRPPVYGTDEDGDLELTASDLTGPCVLVIGNETRGMTAGWRDAVSHTLAIPMAGSASSLNASNAATVLLYEALRQRVAKVDAKVDKDRNE